ncbi:leucine rich repeat [Seminavis robusta]|uniref:Leucine rich repeat n=1 Tax=Seminavis robusta TaxID=568900 RepID=A0A9N8HDX4_9STRA|nr:leucine rich repeat [Seminavis robusta]|eukprot:Sro484_g152180.1 leucine rich repeat (1103) ;mRNA; r:11-3506
MKSKKETERQEQEQEAEEKFVATVTSTATQGQRHCRNQSSETPRQTDSSSNRAVSRHGLHHSKEDMVVKLSAAMGIKESNKMGAENRVGAVSIDSSSLGFGRGKQDAEIKRTAATGTHQKSRTVDMESGPVPMDSTSLHSVASSNPGMGRSKQDAKIKQAAAAGLRRISMTADIKPGAVSMDSASFHSVASSSPGLGLGRGQKDGEIKRTAVTVWHLPVLASDAASKMPKSNNKQQLGSDGLARLQTSNPGAVPMDSTSFHSVASSSPGLGLGRGQEDAEIKRAAVTGTHLNSRTVDVKPGAVPMDSTSLRSVASSSPSLGQSKQDAEIKQQAAAGLRRISTTADIKPGAVPIDSSSLHSASPGLRRGRQDAEIKRAAVTGTHQNSMNVDMEPGAVPMDSTSVHSVASSSPGLGCGQEDAKIKVAAAAGLRQMSMTTEDELGDVPIHSTSHHSVAYSSPGLRCGRQDAEIKRAAVAGVQYNKADTDKETQTGTGTQHQEEPDETPIGTHTVTPGEPLGFSTTPVGADTDTDADPDLDLDASIPPEQAPGTLEDGLPVAIEVSDNFDLPVADLAPTGQYKDRAEMNKQSLILRTLLYGGCVAAVVIMVTVLVKYSRNDKVTNNSVSDSPTYSPRLPENTQNLSGVELLVLEALSNHTLEALEDPNSPQSLAYGWILEDLEENNYTHASRIRQRKEDCTPCEIPSNSLNSSNQAVHMEYDPYQHILLHSNALQGTLPLELFWLTDLKTISISKNSDLTRTISSHIGKLRQLELFYIDVTMISGPIPTELGLLSDTLSIFSAIKAQLEGTVPSELGLLQKFEEFSVDGNMITGALPEELGDATSLDSLVFIGNFLSGTIPESIWHLPLNTLALGQNQLTGTIPTEIGLLSNLTYLSLAFNGFSGEIPSQIGFLTDVAIVNLYFSSFTGTIPTEIGQLSAVDFLGLNSCTFTGTIPTEIGLLTNLRLGFGADGNSLTGSVPSEIGQNINLEALSLGNTNLTGTIPSELANAPLTMLFLENSLLSGSLPEGLSPNIYYLSLSNSTFLTGTIPQNLTSLDFLMVAGTGLSGILPEYVCGDDFLGLSFDCSPLLCGCSCLCSNETNSST